MIRKDLYVQTEQIPLSVSRFLQTDDSHRSKPQITSQQPMCRVNQPKTMTINGEYK